MLLPRLFEEAMVEAVIPLRRRRYIVLSGMRKKAKYVRLIICFNPLSIPSCSATRPGAKKMFTAPL